MSAATAKEKFLAPRVEVSARKDRSMILNSPVPLADYPPSLGHYLYHWAGQAPARTFLAQRDQYGDWQQLDYATALDQAQHIASALLDRGLNSARPLMLLSGNSLNLARMMLGALLAGIPFAPVSPAYSLASTDYGKLKYLFGLLQPGLVYVEHAGSFAAALSALDLAQTEVVTAGETAGKHKTTAISSLLQTPISADLDQAAAGIGPDTVLKILFTSGSTGMPKGVINTHRMMCSNQQAIRQLWPFLTDRPPVIVDWLPWNHTFGGCHNFNMMLCNGGSLYIDEGKPLPGLIEKTVANLREISPTLYFNVPAGFNALLAFLEEDTALCRRFFAELDLLMYAAASLPQVVWDRLEKLSLDTVGSKVPMVSGWGTTETAPLATSTYRPTSRAGAIGLPIPGTQIKLAPHEEKYDLRVKGPNISPGYWNQPEQTKAAFDEEGYYLSGDAVVMADARDPARGILFSGRIAEEFKLDTGSWVAPGNLRVALIEACAPLLQDVVVCGHDRHEIGVLAIHDRKACLALCQDQQMDDAPASLIKQITIREKLRELLQRYNTAHPGSSMRVGRLLFLHAPLSIDAGEITDKGYINQRGVLQNHAAAVERLYSDDPEVLRP
jgi:feruloyl-CoA synthase